MSSLNTIRRGGRKAIGAGVVAAILFLAWTLSHFMKGGTGIGIGTSVENSSAPQPAPATQPVQTIVVTIQEDQYLVDGRETTLAEIISAAGKPSPGHTAVMIVSGPDSRLGARKDLQDALDAAGLSWGMETDPAGQ